MRAKVLMTATLTAAMSLALLAQGPPPGGGQGRGGGRGPQTPPLIMTSTAWEDGGVIPDKYTQAAGPTAPNPALSWSQVPPGTQSFVLLMHDPEPAIPAKSSKMDVTHWLIWNIPGTSTGLPEGVMAGDLPDGSRQVSLRSNGYMGPGAPPGPYHHYTFMLYALDTKLDIPSGAPADAAKTRMAIEDAMDGHVLGKAVLVARFHRQ
ncbi:MAG TPA: YbhB/YbcL family Raf kinase inhibitor-like protein [Vicinamibacterales bacterium]|nr:YbhB/YbcL family Raf kinase inhibitor-like protein [Vicinamibacterales bacterium]